MTRYIVLLRGINVGGHKMVPMARLRALLEKLGYKDVATLLQSGNAVLTSNKKPAPLLKELEAALAKEFGFPILVVLRTSEELARVIKESPFEVDDGGRFLVTFLSGEPDKSAFESIDPRKFLPDEFRASGREIYGHYPNGYGNSKLGATLGGLKLGVTQTARNWNTVLKLKELAGK